MPAAPTESEEGSNEGDPLPDNRLFDLYRHYIGDPDSEADVYLGFGLFFGGIALLGIALVLFVAAGFHPARSTPYFAWAGPAFALGMLAVPTILVGIVVLLPVEDRALYASLGGAAVTLAAVLGFWLAYPQDWNGYGADYTIPIVALYAVGLTAVVASTGAALIAHQIERAKPPSFEEVERHRAEGSGTGEPESWSEEEIERDIEEAMEATDLSWGGVEKSENRRLDLEMDETTIDTTGIDVDPDTTRSNGVDQQVQGLRQLKGEDPKKTTSSDSTVDDQTAALNELKKKKQQGEAPDAPPGEGDGSIVERLRGMFG